MNHPLLSGRAQWHFAMVEGRTRVNHLFAEIILPVKSHFAAAENGWHQDCLIVLQQWQLPLSLGTPGGSSCTKKTAARPFCFICGGAYPIGWTLHSEPQTDGALPVGSVKVCVAAKFLSQNE